MNILNSIIKYIILCLLLQSCVSNQYKLPLINFFQFWNGNYIINLKYENRKMYLKLQPFSDRHFKIEDTEDMSVTTYESYAVYGMGVTLGSYSAFKMEENGIWYRDVHVNIIPTIHFLKKETELLFSKKFASADDEVGWMYRVQARILTLYEKGLKLGININPRIVDKVENYYFDLCDGMYYETDSDENMGNILKVYDFYKFKTDYIKKDKYYWWYDVTLFDNKRKYVGALVQRVQYFKPMENELWMLSPYGNYILDYETMNIRLVDDEIFKGHKYYFCIEKWDGLLCKLGYEAIEIPVKWEFTGYSN